MTTSVERGELAARAQLPRLSDPSIRRVESMGTITALFRLDEGLVARYPFREHRAMPTEKRTWDGDCRGGRPLLEQDGRVRHSIDLSAHLVDTATVTALWDECLRAIPPLT